MAVFAVSITKSVPWRGAPEEYANVYHYQTTPGELFPDEAVIAEVVRLEKLIFASNVTFRVGRTWGPTGEGPEASVTREIVDLSGTGALGPTAGMYRECAILIQWPLGRYGSRNRPQFLRKWLRTQAANGYPTNGADPLAEQPGAGSALRQYMEGITTLDPGGLGTDVLELVTETGRAPVAEPLAYQYLEHRQFHA